MRPFPMYLQVNLQKNVIGLDDFDAYGETAKFAQREQRDAACQTVVGLIKFPKLYNISKSDAPHYVSFREATLFIKQRPRAQEAQQ